MALFNRPAAMCMVAVKSTDGICMAGGHTAAQRDIGSVTWHGTRRHEGRVVADKANEPARDDDKARKRVLTRYAEWWTARRDVPIATKKANTK